VTEEKFISFPYLIKRAVKISIEFVIFLILLFFLPDLINLFLELYGFWVRFLFYLVESIFRKLLSNWKYILKMSIGSIR